MKNKLPFGLKDGKLLHISEVEQGLKCGCICPNCHHPLIARKGTITTHHFAHYKGKECENALETSLHLAAKEILNKHRKIIIPKAELNVRVSKKYKRNWNLSNQRLIQIERVELESYREGYVPDVLAFINGKPLIIEITVTHKTDESKINKIRSDGISVLEIDLSQYDREFTIENLEKEVIYNVSNKIWLYNHKLFKLTELMYNLSEEKLFTKDKVPYCPKGLKQWIINDHIDDPRPARKRRFSWYEDCVSCKYCVYYTDLDTVTVYCLGERKISNIKELLGFQKQLSTT
ncbi:competence protein CoiA family protein [Ureibacillus sp. NPDC094379]